jgi:hypothetical protein
LVVGHAIAIVFAFLGLGGAVTDACMDRPSTLAHIFRQIVALAGC